jgi:hypothetical protein
MNKNSIVSMKKKLQPPMTTEGRNRVELCRTSKIRPLLLGDAWRGNTSADASNEALAGQTGAAPKQRSVSLGFAVPRPSKDQIGIQLANEKPPSHYSFTDYNQCFLLEQLINSA